MNGKGQETRRVRGLHLLLTIEHTVAITDQGPAS
ncbi:hypothetical protein SBI_09346 [Streptomyces bingchenggensis BCW-1]|uniref:Uncharacterized protein n=1 Tax=Streptomyces bingchenggensis (strain BCW-1) TaxID=749414 RepID=D7C5T5_STRBB|nr:hypothetical protein SBI_09346 [Streptomyces bingchenggensis BCW-1]